MKKEMFVKGAAIAIIGGLFIKNIFDQCRDKVKKEALEAEYQDLGCEDNYDEE